MKKEDALNLRFDSDAGNNLTLRQYFEKLLITLWKEGEGFSGKQPFGNSGWKYDIFSLLSENGFIPNGESKGYDGQFIEINEKEADDFVMELIKEVFVDGFDRGWKACTLDRKEGENYND